MKILVAKDPCATLTREQSQRAKQLSEILSQATKVLGSDVAADAWMARKAIGLGNTTPTKVMLMPEGLLALREHLVRMQ